MSLYVLQERQSKQTCPIALRMESCLPAWVVVLFPERAIAGVKHLFDAELSNLWGAGLCLQPGQCPQCQGSLPSVWVKPWPWCCFGYSELCSGVWAARIKYCLLQRVEKGKGVSCTFLRGVCLLCPWAEQKSGMIISPGQGLLCFHSACAGCSACSWGMLSEQSHTSELCIDWQKLRNIFFVTNWNFSPSVLFCWFLSGPKSKCSTFQTCWIQGTKQGHGSWFFMINIYMRYISQKREFTKPSSVWLKNIPPTNSVYCDFVLKIL